MQLSPRNASLLVILVAGYFEGLAALPDGGFVLTGSVTTGEETKIQQLRLVVVDAVGAQRWEQVLGESDNDWGSVVVALRDGLAVLGGTWSEGGAGLADAWLVRTDPLGEVRWERLFGGRRRRPPGHGVRGAARRGDRGGRLARGGRGHDQPRVRARRVVRGRAPPDLRGRPVRRRGRRPR